MTNTALTLMKVNVGITAFTIFSTKFICRLRKSTENQTYKRWHKNISSVPTSFSLSFVVFSSMLLRYFRRCPWLSNTPLYRYRRLFAARLLIHRSCNTTHLNITSNCLWLTGPHTTCKLHLIVRFKFHSRYYSRISFLSKSCSEKYHKKPTLPNCLLQYTVSYI